MRRHIVAGAEKTMVFDTRRQEALEVEPEHLALLACADGTRDVAGILLEASRRGLYRRASTVMELLTGLAERGLLADGIGNEQRKQSDEASKTRPLALLPGFSLSCDANGTCCTTYSTVHFTRDDARRALVLVPAVLDELATPPAKTAKRPPVETVFLPVHSSEPSSMCAVTMVDGRCGYLADDGRCRIQLAAGPAAKPSGCSIYPATFVDDGASVRVSVGVECACVFNSLGRADGAPLVPEGATTAGELAPLSRVVPVPETIVVAAETSASREQLRAWSDAVLASIDSVNDPLRAVWALANHAAEHGLQSAGIGPLLGAAEHEPLRPTAAELGLRLVVLAAKTHEKRKSAEGWRSPQDRCRRLSVWLDDAAQALVETSAVQARLDAGPDSVAHERFYLRAAIFGHLLVGELTLTQALRDRAVRLLLARQMAQVIPTECRDDPSAPFPITAVEAMMRGQGLGDYAHGLP